MSVVSNTCLSRFLFIQAIQIPLRHPGKAGYRPISQFAPIFNQRQANHLQS